jgi:hypothetical protein
VIERVVVVEAANHQSGPREERDSEREFNDDQGSAPTTHPPAVSTPARVFLKRHAAVFLRNLKRGSEAENERGGDANTSHVDHDVVIEGEDEPVRFAGICHDQDFESHEGDKPLEIQLGPDAV